MRRAWLLKKMENFSISLHPTASCKCDGDKPVSPVVEVATEFLEDGPNGLDVSICADRFHDVETRFYVYSAVSHPPKSPGLGSIGVTTWPIAGGDIADTFALSLNEEQFQDGCNDVLRTVAQTLSEFCFVVQEEVLKRLRKIDTALEESGTRESYRVVGDPVSRGVYHVHDA